MHLLARLSVITALLAGLTATAAAEIDPDDRLYFSWDGYRIAHYRSPPAIPVEGGTRVDTAGVRSLLEQPKKPVLVDVQPVGWHDGIFLITKPRLHLPGSIWLPNVGLGEPGERLERYFSTQLEQATDGDPLRPVILYCTADCWMSWNAVKRAHSWGYQNLYWYAEGTDGWREAELDLVTGTPVPLPADY
jgi:PQQ-dependent catabolism-associated CXXCW motif protein